MELAYISANCLYAFRPMPFSSPDCKGADSYSLCFPGSTSPVSWLPAGLANERLWWEKGGKEEGRVVLFQSASGSTSGSSGNFSMALALVILSFTFASPH